MFKSKKRPKLTMLYLCVIVSALSGYATAQSLCECAIRGDLEKINLLIAEGALSLIHISEPTRQLTQSRFASEA